MQNKHQGSLFRWYSQILILIKDFGSLRWLLFLFIFFHFFIGAIIPPLFTSDFERNLFYGKAFWKHGFSVYDMTPLEINPLYDVRDPLTGEYSYSNTTYDYPTLQLLFWAGLSLLPFSPIIAKWVLSSFDVINVLLIFILLRSHESQEKERWYFEKGFMLSYLFFAIPLSAIEGQSTAITVFFLLLPLILHNKYKLFSYASIGLGFHWKYIPVFILPYLLICDHRSVKQGIFGLITLVCSLVVLSFPLLFSNFILRYFRSFGNVGSYSGQLPSNPLLLLYPSVSSVLSLGILILALLFWLGVLPRDDTIKINLEGTIERIYWLPIIILLVFLKIYPTAFPWYWMWFYPCIAILTQRDRQSFAAFLGVTLTIGLIDFVQMTVGFTTFIDLIF